MNLFWNGDIGQHAIAINELRRGNFVKVMIFARNPENRNGFDATLCQAVCQFHRGQCFVNSVERSAEEAGLLSGDHGNTVRFTQALNVFECLFAGAPGAIHSFERAAKYLSIGLMIREHPLDAVWQIVMMLYCFRIKFSEGDWIAQVVKKQLALLWNLIEGNGFDAQSSLFRRAVTGNFNGAQFGFAPVGTFYAGNELSASVSEARA